MEARVAMDIAQVDGTLEFTLGSSANLPAVDLNDTPFKMKEEHLTRMSALSKTGGIWLAFFSPFYTAVLSFFNLLLLASNIYLFSLVFINLEVYCQVFR
jgi:hypothetical protein